MSRELSYEKVDDGYLIRMYPGQEILSSLIEFAKEKNIVSAMIAGIGGVNKIEIGFFNLTIKEYNRKVFEEDLELVSLLGNLSYVNGEPFIHAHGTFGNAQYQGIAGHCFSLMISVTAEIHLIEFSKKIERRLDATMRVNLLDLSSKRK